MCTSCSSFFLVAKWWNFATQKKNPSLPCKKKDILFLLLIKNIYENIYMLYFMKEPFLFLVQKLSFLQNYGNFPITNSVIFQKSREIMRFLLYNGSIR
jgi:hypothetical protein